MTSRPRITTLLLACLLLGVPSPGRAQTTASPRADPSALPEALSNNLERLGEELPAINRLVLEAAYRYPDGGGYEWRDTGVPREIRHRGSIILARSAKGTYCCGYTFAVAVDAARDAGLPDLARLPPQRVRRFQKLWYGSTDEDRTRLMSFAMEDAGLGKEIQPADLLPGDFLQYWRNNGSGHSVVFLGWIYPEGSDADGLQRLSESDPLPQPIGFHYRSSQKSTDGIGDTAEYFDGVRVGETRGRVLRDKLFGARFIMPEPDPGDQPGPPTSTPGTASQGLR